MTAEPRAMFASEVLDVAERFAAAADARLAAIVDPSARAEARTDLWHGTEELGLRGVLVDEAAGGSGGTLVDLAAVLEGFARHALPLPVLAAHGVVPSVLDQVGPRGRDVLAATASGELRPAPVLDALAGYGRTRPGTRIECRTVDGRVVVRGTALGVEAVPDATHLLVGGRDDHGGPVVVLAPVDAVASSTPHVRLDDRSSADLRFDGSVDGDAVLARGEAAVAAVAAALGLATVLSGVETAGSMVALVAETAAYLSERRQFDVPLASFQVLRHAVADMYLLSENLAALTEHTVRVASARRSLDPGAVALVGVRKADAGRQVAHRAIQLHGGMGITEELHATRLARRLLMASLEYGDAQFHAEELLAARRARI